MPSAVCTLWQDRSPLPPAPLLPKPGERGAGPGQRRDRLQPAGPLRASGRQTQAPAPRCHRRNKRTASKQTNKQKTRTRFQSCLPKTSKQSRPRVRWLWRRDPRTVLPSPPPLSRPEKTLESEYSSRNAQTGLVRCPWEAVLKEGLTLPEVG